MKKTIFFELCAESVESAKIAQVGGADRVELCSELAISGITPDLRTISETVRALTIPVHVLIRPRGGDFVYSDEEFALIRQQTLEAKLAGAAGVAIGILLPDNRIDVVRTREIAELAAPMNITFHRAFDETVNLKEALEDVIRSGADCLLTSGGKSTVSDGAKQIAALCRQAGDRLTIMAGGGLSLTNILDVAEATGASYLHGSLIRKTAPSQHGNETAPYLPSHHAADESVPVGEVFLEDVQEAIRLLSDFPAHLTLTASSSETVR